MKKIFQWKMAFFMGIAMFSAMTTSCKDDDDDNKKDPTGSADIIKKIDASDTLEYNAKNKANWNAYMKVVANYLKVDATTLYNDWTEGYENGDAYAVTMKNAGKSGYTETFSSALAATEQIIAGCSDIANEVGEAKIGDPLNLWTSGKYAEGLYAVESWYSWHSRVDYSNNIESVKNAYYGSLNGQVAEQSISAQIAKVDENLDKKVKAAIKNAIDKILAIPQPFRNHIASSEAISAQEACADLKDILDKELTPALSKLSESICENINKNYVDNVVLPTYKSLKEANEDLYKSVVEFTESPSNAGFETLCEKWIASRTFWEKSEAFLFGPVADMGLDPNMDSWPLDQNAIKEILVNGDFKNLNWNGAFDEENDEIAAAQSIRGFHTLEYLIYKAGKARTIK
ncbi:MAG: peptidase M75 [Paludibacteraceae bacterium]|nr:peptidase M75 [Paludibacteraceae bacterium]